MSRHRDGAARPWKAGGNTFADADLFADTARPQ